MLTYHYKYLRWEWDGGKRWQTSSKGSSGMVGGSKGNYITSNKVGGRGKKGKGNNKGKKESTSTDFPGSFYELQGSSASSPSPPTLEPKCCGAPSMPP